MIGKGMLRLNSENIYLQIEINPKLSRMYLIRVSAVLEIDESDESKTPTETDKSKTPTETDKSDKSKTPTESETDVLRCFKDDDKNVDKEDDKEDGTDGSLRKKPVYAILSHRRQKGDIVFEDMKKLTKSKLQTPEGRKVVNTCKVAQREKIKWVWIDSCCTGADEGVKRAAINSMYRWYRCSQMCYVYLHDITARSPREADELGNSVWFFRGWTLQELIGPPAVKFFNSDWDFIGDRKGLAPILKQITRIPELLLTQTRGPGVSRNLTEKFGVAQIMSWAADRETSEPEDRAYSLVGLFGVELKVNTGLYGIEGEKAFQNLQEALIEEYGDQSIFSWSGSPKGNVLAESPNDFRACFDVEPCLSPSPAETGQGLIKTQLRLTRCRGSSYIFHAEFPRYCPKNDPGSSEPIIITLAKVGEVYYRISGVFILSDETYDQEVRLKARAVDDSFEFEVNELISLGAGQWKRDYDLKRPVNIKNGQHTVIRYSYVACNASDHDKSFSVILGFFGNRSSVHVAHDESSEKIVPGVVQQANVMKHLQAKPFRGPGSVGELVMHYHIPRTIQALEVVYKDLWMGGSVTLNVMKCFGCCMPGWLESGHTVLLCNKKVGECFRKIRQSYFDIVSPLKLKNDKLLPGFS